jgi:hypothetical protein
MLVRVMVCNAVFNNISVISWRSVLLVEETGVPRENHWSVASHWQTLSHDPNDYCSVCHCFNNTVTCTKDDSCSTPSTTPYKRKSTIFSYIVAVSFIGGGNRSIQRKPPTCRKSLTSFITWCRIDYNSPWMGFELTPSVIGSDCTGSCKHHNPNPLLLHI